MTFDACLAIGFILLPGAAALFHLSKRWHHARNRFERLLLTLIPIIGPALYFFLLEHPPLLSQEELACKPRNLFGKFGRTWEPRNEALTGEIAAARAEEKKSRAEGKLASPDPETIH